MRIAYCIHSLHNSGGMERVLTLKANALATLPGYEVHIIAAALHGRKPCFATAPAVQVHDLDLNEHLHPRRYARRLEALLCEIRPDITISLAGTELKALPKMQDGSVKMAEFHFSHDKFYLKYGRTLYARWRTRRLEKAVSRLDRFVVLTHEDQADWQRALPGFPVEQIYNPLTFRSPEKAALQNKRCIAVGRLEYQKNFTDLIRAWKIVASKHPDWTLDIFGEGSERGRLEKEIAKASLEGKVVLRGRSSQIRQEMLESSCLVMSSRFEGFPMVLLEAAACGLPMVSYACPMGPAEIIQDGVNGYLAPAGDVKALAEGILSVIEHPDRAQLGAASARTAEAFTPEIIIPQWDQLFHSIVQNGIYREADGRRPQGCGGEGPGTGHPTFPRH